jgi:hypothetical protein
MIEDSLFLQSLDQDNLDEFFDTNIAKEDFRYISSLYLNPALLDLNSSMYLLNTLVKYQFKQLEDYTFLFYFKFGKYLFNGEQFMQMPTQFIKNIHRKNLFREVCKKGLFLAFKWILSLGIIDIHWNKNSYFRTACKYGQIQIAKNIYSLGNIDINLCKNEVFINTAINGHIELFKWLLSFDKFDINYSNNLIFNLACKNNHLEFAKYINSISKNNYTNIDNIFLHVFKLEYFEMIIYIYSLCNINILSFQNIKLNKIKNQKLFKWLYYLYLDDFSENDKEILTLMTLKYSLENFKWLCSINGKIKLYFELLFNFTFEYNSYKFDLEKIKFLYYNNYIEDFIINKENYQEKICFFCTLDCVKFTQSIYNLDSSFYSNIFNKIFESYFINFYLPDRIEVIMWICSNFEISNNDIMKALIKLLLLLDNNL